MKDKKKIKIAVLSSYTANNIKEPLAKYLDEFGFFPEIRFGGYNQFNEEFHDDSSWLNEFNPDIIFALFSTRTFFPAIFDKLNDYDNLISEAKEKIDLFFEAAGQYLGHGKIIVTSFDYPLSTPLGIMDINSRKSVHSFVTFANEMLLDYSTENQRVSVLDFDRICSIVGKNKITDNKMFYLGKIVLSKETADKLAEEMSVFVNAAFGKIKKIIVTDLDNTLWGGVIGEDGVEGVKIGDTNIGKIYSDIQKILLNYKKLGIVLAISSKNNEEDVMPVFQKKEMILKSQDFVSMKINWKPKSENIIEIAEELNLGLDSFLFLDDNPSERLEVKTNIPEIEIIDFPNDVSNLPDILMGIKSLKKLELTAEDKKRHEMYSKDRERSELRKKIPIEEYLKKLDISIEVKINDANSIDRITQLINKTNQFNVRTQRYSKEQVISMMNSKEYLISSVSVWDKFGELGLTGIIILKRENEIYFIDTFLMSCRVLSRGIEKQFFYETIKKIENGKLKAEFIKSPKNSVCMDFYESIGFTKTEEKENIKKYELDLKNYQFKDLDYIRVK